MGCVVWGCGIDGSGCYVALTLFLLGGGEGRVAVVFVGPGASC